VRRATLARVRQFAQKRRIIQAPQPPTALRQGNRDFLVRKSASRALA
jgi:hypothetical protein